MNIDHDLGYISLRLGVRYARFPMRTIFLCRSTLACMYVIYIKLRRYMLSNSLTACDDVHCRLSSWH